jgi:hypothetical protein
LFGSAEAAGIEVHLSSGIGRFIALVQTTMWFEKVFVGIPVDWKTPYRGAA